jgi:hypothetical protein
MFSLISLISGVYALVSDCHSYYWFDNTNKNCSQKQFCGMYMYQDLQTFNTIEECIEVLEFNTCNSYYWFDNTNKNCSQKQFCGMYMYQDLQTFNTIEECIEVLEFNTCNSYYWFDNTNKNCDQQKFCGMYMYYGLQTFDTKSECLSEASKTIECTKDIDCPSQLPYPYCKNNQLCANISSEKCINPGTSQSYCNSTWKLSCNTCQYGCENNKCVKNDTTVICPQDMKTCPNGLSVSRNPANNCEFECSEEVVCTQECNSPVCCEIPVQCIKAPCPPIKQTKCNGCVCSENKGKVSYQGECDERIKIMPETASQTAINRLGDLNFTIELKEVGKGNNAKQVYELTGNKQGKFLGIFKIMARVQAQVDAETGDVKVIKPWWAFLATGI